MSSLQHEWKWEDNDGSFKQFKGNLSSKFDKLNIGECYTMHFRNKQYEIQKISKVKCTQRNTETNYTRNVMLIEQNKKNNINYHWYWQDNNGKLHPYSDAISIEIQQLNISDTYYVFLDDIAYSITKTAKDAAQQTNLRTTYSRDVVRQNKQQIINDKDDMKQNFVTDTWFWKDDKNKFNAFDEAVSHRISNLNTGESMKHNTVTGQYELIKLSVNKAQQTNIESNNVREIRKMSSDEAHNYNQNANKKKYHVPVPVDDDEKQLQSGANSNKWFFEDDKGVFNPIDGWLSTKIDKLTIGDVMKQKLRNSTYQFKKTNIGKGTQQNMDTNKVRMIKCGEYGWFFEDNDKSLIPYSADLSKKLNGTLINSSFTFSKNIHKYCVTKLSQNHAKQKNLSTKVARNVVKKMILNDNENESTTEESKHAQSNGDWLRKRYAKAMKSGKIDRVHLISKRNLHENWADYIFRTCESQFARSCDKFGKETNGMNKIITEVEYIINPKLIKKFEAKKKQIMGTNACKESDLNIILAWHGTPAANLDTIVKKNFDLSKLGDNKKNKGYYGCGIYFSEFARISNVYGDGLLACKVILGKQYMMKFGKPEIGRTLEPGYDSHIAVKNNSEYGREVCIFDVDQILPCYIVKY